MVFKHYRIGWVAAVALNRQAQRIMGRTGQETRATSHPSRSKLGGIVPTANEKTTLSLGQISKGDLRNFRPALNPESLVNAI